MRSMVGSLIIDAGAVLVPFHRKMHSSARQGGQSGDEVRCRGWLGVVDGCVTVEWYGGVKTGATMISFFPTDGLVAELKCGC